MVSLDDPIAIRTGDPGAMLDRIRELPDEVERAWQHASSFSLPLASAESRAVVVLGMGGSAIGADLLRTLVEGECRLPFAVNRGYELPGYVGPETLVIASSYSGETEETLRGYAEARARGARLVAVTTGGTLAREAERDGVPLHRFSYPAQPRAALAHSLLPLLRILQQLGWVRNYDADVAEAAAVLRGQLSELDIPAPESGNPAKQLARRLHGRIPVVYGAGLLAEVARRWKGQFNENAKNWAFFEVLPELNHNALVGYEHPAAAPDWLLVVQLVSDLYDPRNRLRVQITGDILDRRGIAHVETAARGRTGLAQMLSAVFLGDWTSFYLALLNGADPTPVEIISYLKQQLAAQ